MTCWSFLFPSLITGACYDFFYPSTTRKNHKGGISSVKSFLDLYLEFDDSGQLSTKIYDKRDDFNFKIINFPNMCSNISASPAYGVYISQLMGYARASSNYSDFLKRHLHLRNRLLDQGYKKTRLIRSLKKVYIPIPRSCRNVFRLCRNDCKRCVFVWWGCMEIKKSRKMSRIFIYQCVT
jgi:GH15 family glucan-1,4-alpha-glucosidase